MKLDHMWAALRGGGRAQTLRGRPWPRRALLSAGAAWLAGAGVVSMVERSAWAQAPEPVRFVIIGDFGSGSTAEAKVAKMVLQWKPDVILTVGDNAYSDHNPQQNAFEKDVIKYYKDYIRSVKDDPLGEKTRFFPTLGNHDYAAPGGGVFKPRVEAYEKIFAVPQGPGGHHYYELALAQAGGDGGARVITTGADKAQGVIRFFALDSNRVKGWDGHKTGSAQEIWFRERLKASKEAGEPWQIALFHQTPYVSGSEHADETHMREWELEKSGLTAVVAGHEHVYERVMMGAFPFITNGLGGAGMYPFQKPYVDGSKVRYGVKEPGEASPPKYRHGALFGEATKDSLALEFWNASGQRKDRWPENGPGLRKEPQGQGN